MIDALPRFFPNEAQSSKQNLRHTFCLLDKVAPHFQSVETAALLHGHFVVNGFPVFSWRPSNENCGLR